MMCTVVILMVMSIRQIALHANLQTDQVTTSAAAASLTRKFMHLSSFESKCFVFKIYVFYFCFFDQEQCALCESLMVFVRACAAASFDADETNQEAAEHQVRSSNLVADRLLLAGHSYSGCMDNLRPEADAVRLRVWVIFVAHHKVRACKNTVDWSLLVFSRKHPDGECGNADMLRRIGPLVTAPKPVNQPIISHYGIHSCITAHTGRQL